MAADTGSQPGAIPYPQWLIKQIEHPGEICGPDIIDDRAWWQHLPGLNPYAELEAQLRAARRQQAHAEAEAG
jgi:hypothetical protein